jgi:phage-related protein
MPEMLIVRSLPLVPIIIALVGGVLLTVKLPTIDRFIIPEIQFSIPVISLDALSSTVKFIYDDMRSISFNISLPSINLSFFEGIIHSVLRFFQSVVEAGGDIISEAINGISSAVGTVIRAIVTLLEFMGNILMQVFSASLTFIVGVFKYLFGAVSAITGIITGFFSDIFNTIATPFKVLTSYIKTQKPFFDFLSTTIKVSVDSMRTSFGDSLNLFSEVARASQH